MRCTCRIIVAALVAVGLAELSPSTLAQSPPATPQAAPAPVGLKDDITRSIEDAEKKLIALAEKFPQEKYAWHPEGARTTAEVFMHVASGNYAYAGGMGATRPEGTAGDVLSKITDKAQVIDALKKSFAHIKSAVANSDPDKAIKFRGRESAIREVLINAATHCHEHMGQLIAYARVNGIVPPWSEEAARAPAKN